MNNNDITPVAIQRAAEQLRQETETFEQRRKQEHWWFVLRLIMGFTSIVLLGAVMVIATYILLNHDGFPSNVVNASGATLFADVLGLLIGVWKVALNPKSVTKLEPVTNTQLSEASSAHDEN